MSSDNADTPVLGEAASIVIGAAGCFLIMIASTSIGVLIYYKGVRVSMLIRRAQPSIVPEVVVQPDTLDIERTPVPPQDSMATDPKEYRRLLGTYTSTPLMQQPEHIEMGAVSSN